MSTLPTRPPKATAAQVRSALRLYTISANLTGTFLLLLTIELIAKRGFGYELMVGGFNVSLAVLIIHGWLFVLYVAADLNLWTKMRWPLQRFIVMVLGGVVPFLSFIMERRIRTEVFARMDEFEERGPRY